MSTPKIKNRDLALLLKALNALDGHPEPVEVSTTDGKVQKVIHTVPYKFSGKTRLAIAKWMSAVKAASDTVSKTHDALVRQYADPAKPEMVSPDNTAAFEKDFSAVLDTDADITGVSPVLENELDLDANPVPVSVLSVLAPVLISA